MSTTQSEENIWRLRSIEKFGLSPVPKAWKVLPASEAAWKRYYKHRIVAQEMVNDEWFDLLDAVKPLCGLNSRKCASFYIIWSPYAIPRAFVLERRHMKCSISVRYYKLLDFDGDESLAALSFKTSCSSCYQQVTHHYLTKSATSRFLCGCCGKFCSPLLIHSSGTKEMIRGYKCGNKGGGGLNERGVGNLRRLTNFPLSFSMPMYRVMKCDSHRAFRAEPLRIRKKVTAYYCDSDFGGHKSGGFLVLLNGMPLTWKKLIHGVAAVSSTEAEYYAVMSAWWEDPKQLVLP